MARQQIIIADDHPLFRDALRQALSTSLEDALILEASGLEDLTTMLSSRPDIDLVLLDLSMPGVRGYSGLMYLRAQHPEIPVVVVSANEDFQTIRTCLGFGASGYVPKSNSVDVIREAIGRVLAGQVWWPPDFDPDAKPADDTTSLITRLATLTPQQVRVLMMLGEGLLNKQIAYELGVSEATVKAHVSAILQKLGVDSRTQAVIAVNKIEAGDWQRLGEAGSPS
ncbi:MAG: response regulator [Rhizobiales bacterium]|nr:response regulator [Hyphomicrobiales bacterium]